MSMLLIVFKLAIYILMFPNWNRKTLQNLQCWNSYLLIDLWIVLGKGIFSCFNIGAFECQRWQNEICNSEFKVICWGSVTEENCLAKCKNLTAASIPTNFARLTLSFSSPVPSKNKFGKFCNSFLHWKQIFYKLLFPDSFF